MVASAFGGPVGVLARESQPRILMSYWRPSELLYRISGYESDYKAKMC